MLVAALFIAHGQMAAARGGGPGGGGGSPHFGGPSSQAYGNANEQFVTDRETGIDRAQGRISAQGKANAKATDSEKENASPANKQGRGADPARGGLAACFFLDYAGAPFS